MWSWSCSGGRARAPRRVAACLLAVLPGLGRAAPPATPCDAAAVGADLAALRKRLDAATDRAAWPALADEAEAAAGRAAAPEDRACAHYLAAAGHFFLSDRGGEARLRAALAVRHLLAAQALAPEAMNGRQPRARLKTGWQRVGPVDGWTTKEPADARIEAQPEAGTLTLSPATPARWIAACGDAPACREALDLTTAVGPQGARSMSLRPGKYLLKYRAACGTAEGEVDFAGGAIALPAPPPCAVTLDVRDGEAPLSAYKVLSPDAKPIDAGAVTAALGRLRVEAPGFRAASVALPPAGGPVRVALERCPVRVEVPVEPADARVEGAEPAPWGLREIRIERPGHVARKLALDLAAPAACDDAVFRVEERLVLSRRVSVVARDAEGRPVTPTRIAVDGAPTALTGFERPAGTYAFRAENPDYGTISGTFTVENCASDACDPATLDLRFGERRREGASKGPALTMGLGGVLIAGGLASGAAAYATQKRIDDYGTRAEEGYPIDSLLDRRAEQARAADVLVGLGATALVTGLVWHLIDGAGR